MERSGVCAMCLTAAWFMVVSCGGGVSNESGTPGSGASGSPGVSGGIGGTTPTSSGAAGTTAGTASGGAPSGATAGTASGGAPVQCQQPTDCCETRFAPDPQCSTWAAECTSSPTTYPNACSLATGPLCSCTAQSFNCVNATCSQVRCKTTSDCCLINGFVRLASCDTYAANCLLDPTTYASDCTLANGPTCICNDDVARYACVANQCVNVVT